MANNQTTNFILTIQAELSGAKKFAAAQKTIEDTVKQTGRTLDKVTEVLKANTQVVQQKNGPAYLKLDAVYRTAKGNIERLTAKLDENGKVLDGNAQNVSVVTSHFNKMSGATTGLIGHLGNLAKRAFAVIIVWQGLRTIFGAVTRGIGESIKFFVDYEAALADIQVASEASREELGALGAAILDVGKKFGVGFKDATDAAVILAQQGKTSTEIIETLGPAIQLSVASSRSLKDIIEDLTAVQGAYNLTTKDTARITDAIQAVQTKYVISTADLASGLRRVGPVAAQLGVTFEQTIGLITAIQGVTRRSGETVGNSVRTILTRLQGDRLQAIQALAQIPTFLDEEGKATFRVTANNRELIPILSDLAKKWDTLSVTQKNNIGVTVAGRTQVTAFLTLMDEFKTAIAASETALNSQGATLRASSIITETVKSKVSQLTAGWQAFLEALGNSKGGDAIGGTTKFVLNSLITAVDFYTQKINEGRKKLSDFNKEQDGGVDRSKQAADRAKKEAEAKALVAKSDENRATILEKIGKRERELLSKNASDLQVVIGKRKLLRELAAKAGFIQDGEIVDPNLKKTDQSLLKDKLSLQRKKELNILNLENESALKRLESFGFNDLEIQIKRIGFEKQKADEIAKTTGLAADYTKVQEEQIKLQDLLNQKITEQSNKLKDLLQSGFKDFLLGKNENIIGNFSSGIRDSFASSTASGLADFVSKSGIADLFGGLNVGLSTAFSGAGPFAGITQAHINAMPFVQKSIIQAHQQGAKNAQNTPDQEQSFLRKIFGPGPNATPLGVFGGGVLGAIGGLSGGPFGQSKVGNSIFGAVQGAATAYNPILGAAVGVIGGLFSLFRKPKRTVDVKEENRSFQIASKIEVTNNKLDIVNRNLVAIKGALETFILPDSAFFSTKRNLEDNFALNQRRGLG